MTERSIWPLALVALLGCKNAGQRSAEDAAKDVQKLVEIVDKDVAEVERGLPEGAKKIVAPLEKDLKDADPKSNLPAVRSALLKMRRDVPDLGIAKSTFFAYADDKGIAYRNDFENDTMAGQDLVAAWPGLKPVTEGTAFVATNGPLPGPKNPATALDKDWVAAVPVKKADGSKFGVLVTGWTYRRFAYHLQVTAAREVQDQLMRAGDKGKMPVLYVCMFDQESAYCATAPGATPVPPVCEKALIDAKLHAATQGGPAQQATKVDERDFGWAAARAPRLGPDVGVVVLRSNVN